MSALAGTRSRPVTVALQAEQAALTLAVAALAVVGVLTLVAAGSFELPRLLSGDQLLRFAAAALVYLCSHVLRFLRLALLAYRPGVQLRRILQIQLLTAGLSVVLPFKLSDLVRLRELGIVLGDFRTGLVILWLERTFDAAILLVLAIVCAVALPGSLELLAPLLAVVGLFLLVTILLLTIVPANLQLAMLHVVRRDGGERDLRALSVMRAVLTTLRPVPALLRGRVPTLLLLSAGIWLVEVAAVAIAVPDIGEHLSELSAGLLSVLASVSSGLTPLLPESGERLRETLSRFSSADDVAVYRAVLTVPMLVAGAIGGATYLGWRAKRVGVTR